MDEAVLGVEIGGTKVQVALGNRRGELFGRARGVLPEGGDATWILDWICEHSEPLIAEGASTYGGIRGIGVGFGGPVESDAGRVVTSHHVAGWDAFELGVWFEDRFDVPTRISNDSNAAGWAEYSVGAGQGSSTCCYMNIGSGVGGALIVDGRLHDGQGTGAFEIGHTVFPFGAESAPMRIEDVCSGWAVERAARDISSLEPGTPLHSLTEGNPENITCAMIGEAAASGDRYARDVIDTLAGRLGLAVANAITLIHPERFIIGGGVSLMGEVLFEPLRREVDRHIFVPYRGSVEILPAALGEDVVLVGTLLLAGGAGKSG